MEPVVVVVKEIKNGKIMLTEDELKTIVRRAYNDGYWEGRKNCWYGGGITYTGVTNTPSYITTNGTSGDPDKYANITITCDEDRNSIRGQINLFDSMIGDFIND